MSHALGPNMGVDIFFKDRILHSVGLHSVTSALVALLLVASKLRPSALRSTIKFRKLLLINRLAKINLKFKRL